MRMNVFRWNLLQLSSCLKCAMSEIGPVIYSRLQKGSHSDPWEMIIHSHRRWPLKFKRALHSYPWKVVSQAYGLWSPTTHGRWSLRPREVVIQTSGRGRGVEPDHGTVNCNTALFRATTLFFLTLLTSVLNLCAAYPRNARNRLEDYLMPKPRHLQSE